MTRARSWHAVTATVVAIALLLQLVLVIGGESVLAETARPDLGTRLARFVSYFTIQSNLLVLVTTAQLARDPERDGGAWRVVRAAAVAGITVTGIVHFLLLRPLLDLEDWNYAADKLLHLVVPLLAGVGWLLFGPRPRMSAGVVARAIVWPLAWLALTLTVGGISGWYPYPFLDPAEEGWGAVVVACVGVTALFLGLFLALLTTDRRLARAPGSG